LSSNNPADALVLDAKRHIRVPPSLNKCLRPYQREGVQFLFQRYALGRGAIVGDDMGLGKTIQVISFLSALMRKSGTPSDKERRRNRVSQLQDGSEWRDGRKLPPPDDKWPTALIVTPSSVVHVWTREFDKVNDCYFNWYMKTLIPTRSGVISNMGHILVLKGKENGF
jgi:SNF2 family DNA or RNA helicase